MFEPLPKSPIGAMLRRLSPTRNPVCLQPLPSASKRGVIYGAAGIPASLRLTEKLLSKAGTQLKTPSSTSVIGR